MTAYLARRFANWFTPVWLPSVMMAVVTMLICVNVSQSDWVADSSGLISATLWGFIFSLLLSRTRWSGLAASLYTGSLALAFTAQTVGSIIPSRKFLASQSFQEALNGINLRLWNFLQRVNGWGSQISGGDTITDTGLFVAIFCFILWVSMFWMVWFVIRRRQALPGLSPVAFIIGINTYLSGQDRDSFWMFLLASLLLIGYNTIHSLRTDWDHRGVDYPDDPIDWIVWLLAFSVLMAIIIRLSPLFGTAEGWEQLREMLSKPQQVAVDVSDQLFSEINPPEVESEFLSTSAASLRVIGSSIPTNDSTVMWVKLSDPPPPPRNAVPSASQTFIHYWRNEIHATYQGTGWEPPAYSELPAADYSESEDYQFGRYRLTQEFQLVAQHDDRLFSANQPVSADPDITFAISESDQSILLQGDADSYQVESLATRLLEVQLNTAGEEYPEAILATYLQLPDSLPERVRNLAGRLVSSADSPYEKAVKIQDYLRQNYPYDLETPAPPSGRDAVDYFLFEGQSGFCTYYATAMAVLLRTQGVPARVVSGYAMGEYDQELAAYRVPASAVHAWVEVYFPRFGWVEFEPTPSQSAIQYLEGSFSVEEAGDPEAVDIRRWPLLANPMRSAGILALLIIAILGVYLLVGYFKQLPWNRTTQGKISLHYWKIRRALQNAGIRAEVTETPEEFLFINATHLSEYSKLLQALKNATSLYQQAQYSPIVPDVGAVNSAKATWRLALPDLLRLYSRSIRRHRRAV